MSVTETGPVDISGLKTRIDRRNLIFITTKTAAFSSNADFEFPKPEGKILDLNLIHKLENSFPSNDRIVVLCLV